LHTILVPSARQNSCSARGRIITPLKDRYGAQIRTHYPLSWGDEIAIVEQEHVGFPNAQARVQVPTYMKAVIAEINQGSGVSVRVSIANYETLLSSAFKRALHHVEDATPRVSDLPAIVASTTGKIEMESVEEGREARVVEDMIKRAVLNVFGRYFNLDDFSGLVARFDEGLMVEVGADVWSGAYANTFAALDDPAGLLRPLGGCDGAAAVASAVEFTLEGLHLNRRLNRDVVAGRYRYSAQPQVDSAARPPIRRDRTA
jgi:magnesium chelatase subunit I